MIFAKVKFQSILLNFARHIFRSFGEYINTYF